MEELVEVQTKYERERRTRMLLEEKVRYEIQILDCHIYFVPILDKYLPNLF